MINILGTAGADFIYDVPTVSFDAVGTLESTSSEDCITIVDDRIAEFNESLRCFILRKPEMRGIVVKDPNATTFTICDDDRTYYDIVYVFIYVA